MNKQGELTKSESTQLKGLAILFMVMLHLFCRKTDLPYSDVTFWNVPLSYFFGLFGDQCVAIYCFCSGYAHCLLRSTAADTKTYVRASLYRLLRFLISFWIVVLTFSAIGLLVHSADIPCSFSELSGNLFLYNLTYNGAWWFVLTYCILTLLSPVLYHVCRKLHPELLTIIFFAIYAVGYFYRFKKSLNIANPVINNILWQIILLSTSIFPYMIGMMFYEHKWITSIRSAVNKINIPNYLLRIAGWTVIVAMMAFHRIVEGLYVAVLIAVVTIILFSVVPRTKAADKILLFFGGHSTNIWLIHMFFYLKLFKDFVFIARWPIPIFLLMMAVCVAASYVLQFLQKGAVKLFRL